MSAASGFGAATDYLQTRRDAELGRTRDRERPYLLYYPLPEGRVRVLDERDGTSTVITEQITAPHKE